SPCVLPIFPAYMSYITGISVKELQGDKDSRIRRKLLSHALIFLIAVSLVFIGLGAGASFLGQWVQNLLFVDSGKLIQRIACIYCTLWLLLIFKLIGTKFIIWGFLQTYSAAWRYFYYRYGVIYCWLD